MTWGFANEALRAVLRPYFAFGRDVLRETDREPMVSNYAGGTYQGITDSLVLFFDGERTLSAYLRSDTLQKTIFRESAPPRWKPPNAT